MQYDFGRGLWRRELRRATQNRGVRYYIGDNRILVSFAKKNFYSYQECRFDQDEASLGRWVCNYN